MPNSSIAWVAYSEQDGSYLHLGARLGEIHLLQNLISRVRILLAARDALTFPPHSGRLSK